MKKHTHLFIRLFILLFLAVVRLAFGQFAQVGFGQLVQRLSDGVAVAAEGQVVGGMASGGEEVWIRPFPQQQLDQLEVLLVDSEVQGAAAVTLLLRGGKVLVSAGIQEWSP